MTAPYETTALSATDGDVMVLRWNAGEISGEEAVEHGRTLHEALRQQGKDVTVLVVPMGYDLELVDEEEMQLWGWVRPARNAEKLIEAKLLLRVLNERTPDPDLAERVEDFCRKVLP